MKKVLIVGQAPPIAIAARPYERTRLWRWIADAGIEFDQFEWSYSSVVQAYPGRTGSGDRGPTSQEINAARPRLRAVAKDIEPDAIVLLGAAASRTLLADEWSPAGLDAVVGRLWHVEGMGSVVVLPHPSGRSTWVHSSDERQMLLWTSLHALKQILRSP